MKPGRHVVIKNGKPRWLWCSEKYPDGDGYYDREATPEEAAAFRESQRFRDAWYGRGGGGEELGDGVIEMPYDWDNPALDPLQ